MKLNIEIEKSKIAVFKKIIQQLKKTCPNQTIYLTIDDYGIKFITDYNELNKQYIDSFFNIGIEYFIKNKTLESRKENNLIVLKIKDFSGFANNFAQISDTCTSVSLILSKEGEQRYIKVKANESDALQTLSKSEIMLHFNELEFPRIDEKLLMFQISTKDIVKLLDIATKKECDIHITIEASVANQNQCKFTMRLPNPQIKIEYSHLQIQEWNKEYLNENDVFFKDYVISNVHCKQLAQICSVDENISIAILQSDQNILLEFWETHESDLIIAIKSYVIPQLDNMEQEFQKLEDIKQEEQQQQEQQMEIEQRQQLQKNKSAIDNLDEESEDDI